MKLFSVTRWQTRLIASALLLFAGSSPALAQTSNSNSRVTVTLPTNGSSFTTPASVEIKASVSNPPVGLAAMTFFATPVGGPIPLTSRLGTVSNGIFMASVGWWGNPQWGFFSFTWTNALVGTWALTAEAIGSNGLPAVEKNSLAVIISVQTNQGFSNPPARDVPLVNAPSN
jgi:hypothetical protein